MLSFPWRLQLKAFEVFSSFGLSWLSASLLNLNSLLFFTSYFISLLENLACNESKRRYLYPHCENVYSVRQILSVVCSLYIFRATESFPMHCSCIHWVCIYETKELLFRSLRTWKISKHSDEWIEAVQQKSPQKTKPAMYSFSKWRFPPSSPKKVLAHTIALQNYNYFASPTKKIFCYFYLCYVLITEKLISIIFLHGTWLWYLLNFPFWLLLSYSKEIEFHYKQPLIIFTWALSDLLEMLCKIWEALSCPKLESEHTNLTTAKQY